MKYKYIDTNLGESIKVTDYSSRVLPVGEESVEFFQKQLELQQDFEETGNFYFGQEMLQNEKSNRKQVLISTIPHQLILAAFAGLGIVCGVSEVINNPENLSAIRGLVSSGILETFILGKDLSILKRIKNANEQLLKIDNLERMMESKKENKESKEDTSVNHNIKR